MKFFTAFATLLLGVTTTAAQGANTSAADLAQTAQDSTNEAGGYLDRMRETLQDTTSDLEILAQKLSKASEAILAIRNLNLKD